MRTILFAAALLAGAGCAKSESASGSGDKSAATAEAEAKIPTLTVDEVDRMLANKQAQPVDANGQNTRKRLGVVPGAVLLTDEETYAASELPADKTAKLVFYCANSG